MTELKFGVFVPQGWRMDLADVHDPIEKFETMSRCATEAERAGFDAIWVYDHFHTVPTPQLEATFECWTSMAALARDTSTIRLGQMDACNFNADVETVRHKLDVLREHCAAVGRDYDSVLKTIEFYAILGDKSEVDRVVSDTARRAGQDEGFIRSWYPWFGDADHIARGIQEYVEAGIEYVIVNVPNAFEGG